MTVDPGGTGRPIRPWLWSGSGLLLFVLLYIVVAVFYGHSTRLDVSAADVGATDDPAAVDVVLEVTKVDATASLVEGTLQVFAEEYVDDRENVLDQTITVDLVAANPASEDYPATRSPVRSSSTTFKQGRSSFGLSVPVQIRTDGNYQTYPFDTMVSQLLVFVSVGGKSSITDGIPVNLQIVGDAPGWLIRDAALLDDNGQDILTELSSDGTGPQGRFATELYLARAGSTKTFVILLLVAMIVLGVLALLVARAVRTKRRRIEATMASWFAAMLFAVIPLRLNMPGSPPIGVWIDFLVLLWVELALMIGLAVFVGSWLRYSPAPRSEPPAHAPSQGADR